MIAHTQHINVMMNVKWGYAAAVVMTTSFATIREVERRSSNINHSTHLREIEREHHLPTSEGFSWLHIRWSINGYKFMRIHTKRKDMDINLFLWIFGHSRGSQGCAPPWFNWNSTVTDIILWVRQLNIVSENWVVIGTHIIWQRVHLSRYNKCLKLILYHNAMNDNNLTETTHW